MAQVENGRRGGGSGLSVRALVSGVLISIAVTVICGILTGLVAAVTEWEGPPPRSLRYFNYFSVAIGGLLAGRIAGRIGWLHGAVVGVGYMALIGLLAGRGAAAGHTGGVTLAGQLLSGFVVGVVGGMLGVNTR